MNILISKLFYFKDLHVSILAEWKNILLFPTLFSFEVMVTDFLDIPLRLVQIIECQEPVSFSQD